MTPAITPLSRRQLLASLGAMVVVAPIASFPDVALAEVPAGKPPLKPTELDSWVAIAKDGRVTAFFGKPDMGQGVDIAIAQIVGDELDVPMDKIDLVLADTALTVNQGGVSGSTGVQRGGIALRNAAAEARRIMLEEAAQRFKVPVERLQVDGGVISVVGQPEKHISYAELVKGGFFHAQLEWNGQYGNNLVATGKAKPKTPDQYKLVGTSQPRRDIAGKVYGDGAFVADLKRPNMLYGRMIRPEVAGARPVSVDEASIASIPGAKVIRKADLIGVVAEREWDAVQAARMLKVVWSDAKPPFVPHGDVYEHINQATAAKKQIETHLGDSATAFAKPGAKLIEAEYHWPFQSHASLAPACALAEFNKDGSLTIWHASQKPHATSEGIGKMLGLPTEKVRSITVAGPGSYGRNGEGDAAADAAVLAQITGRPVRVQGARVEGHGWDPKGAASVHKARAVIGGDGKIEAYEYMSKGFSRADVATAESEPNAMLAGMLLGFDNPPTQFFNVPEERYEIANRTMGWETIAALLPGASPLRTSHLRDPLGPQLHFASESFIDECAYAAGADPVAFRLAHLKSARDAAVINAAADKMSWKPGPANGPRKEIRDGKLVGQGIAYVRRGDTMVATVVEVEVDPATGRVWPRRYVVAHDCGLIVNPRGLRLCIEANVVQSTSRSLFEEVKFDEKNVTSVDWVGYPILDITDAPEVVDVVMINHPEIAPSGAGEPSSRPTAAALGNAIFDATGVRLRQVPFTKERVKAALDSAKTA